MKPRTLHYTTRERANSWEALVETQHIANECETAEGYFINGYASVEKGGYSKQELVEFRLVTAKGQTLASANAFYPALASVTHDVYTTMNITQHPAARITDIALMKALGEFYTTVGRFAEAMVEAYEPLVERARAAERERLVKQQERELEWRREREEQAAKRQAERERKKVWIDERREALQWYLDQNMRLKRHGYRSIVMGRISNISESGGIHVITERNAALYTAVDALEMFEVKFEGDRSYTRVELPPPHDGMELRKA